MTATEATVDWAEVKATPKVPVDGYNVYLRQKGKKDWKKVTKKIIKKSQHRLADLIEETEYEVQVTTTNDSGESKPSEPSDMFKTLPKTGKLLRPLWRL